MDYQNVSSDVLNALSDDNKMKSCCTNKCVWGLNQHGVFFFFLLSLFECIMISLKYFNSAGWCSEVFSRFYASCTVYIE